MCKPIFVIFGRIGTWSTSTTRICAGILDVGVISHSSWSECSSWRYSSGMTWDRCYDFWNIFAEKFSEKIGVFDSKQRWIMQKFDHRQINFSANWNSVIWLSANEFSAIGRSIDHNIGFWEKTPFFRRKLSKIAENCDHNIDPAHQKSSFCKFSFN
jgi:hypothetical protein